MSAIGRAIWQAQPGDHIFSVDESEFRLLPALRAMWTKVAHTFRIPTPDYNASIWAFGAVELFNGHWISGLYDRQTAANFVAFLEQIWAAYPSGHVWIIIDHAPAHTAKRVSAWLEAHPRIHFHFTPKGASWMNMVEAWFSVLTRKSIRRGSFDTVPALVRHIRSYIRHWNQNPVMNSIP